MTTLAKQLNRVMPLTKRGKHALAVRIADELFTNGQGERAQRLVLTVDTPKPMNLGGWGYLPVIDLIERMLAPEET